jgi:gliding motility associated protien GldN
MVYYLGYLGESGTTPLVDEYGEPYIDFIEEDNQQLSGEIDDTGVAGSSLDGLTTFRYDAPDTIWYNSEDIVEYHLKEDWFFDKSRSEMDVRIIAIAPVVYKYEMNANGDREITGKKELFWLYFPHCRFVFNNYYVYNSHNDAYRISFDDLFWKRRFSSYIYKESNVYDRQIESYRHGVDALYESEEITNEIRNFEHDLWSF